jgi:radical SAM protein (TIGR04043 family)
MNVGIDVENLVRLKADLLTLGIKGDVQRLRSGGGGIAGAGFEICDLTISAPLRSSSPFKLVKKDGEHVLTKNGVRIGKVSLPPYPKYYELKTEDGIPYSKYVALDGMNCLVTSLSRKCIHWNTGKKCSFCSIQLGDPVWDKNPEILAEAVSIAYQEDKNRHLVITSGTFPDRDATARRVAEAIRVIRQHCDIPIQVQIEPVRKELIDEIYMAGADSIGFNIESFDPYVRSRHIPAKEDLKKYLSSWNYALKLFGDNQVSSWIILGLGEREDVTKAGLELVASSGVIPFIAPLNPPKPSGKSLRPPASEYLLRVSAFAAEKMKEYGVSPRKSISGCTRCGGCSLVGDLTHYLTH